MSGVLQFTMQWISRKHHGSLLARKTAGIVLLVGYPHANATLTYRRQKHQNDDISISKNVRAILLTLVESVCMGVTVTVPEVRQSVTQ